MTIHSITEQGGHTQTLKPFASGVFGSSSFFALGKKVRLKEKKGGLRVKRWDRVEEECGDDVE
jgi:hypothetical protein